MTNIFNKISKLLKHTDIEKLVIRSFLDTKNITAGIIVIGDELLKGDVVDTNSHYMAVGLHKLGIKVQKISVVGDVLKDISEEVKLFSNIYTYVITSGGIGPTHDDVTFEAIAKAFNQRLISHPDLVQLCTQFYKTDDPSYPGMKLAQIPESAKLNFLTDPTTGKKTAYPNVSINNVYILPGIPQLCQKSFDLLGSTVFKSPNKFYTKIVYCNVTEDKIASQLNSVVKEFPDVLIGSYPQMFNNSYKVRITIESTVEKSALNAYKKLLQIVPNENIVTF